MGKNYTLDDLFSYGGFIAGIATFMVSTTSWNVHHLIRLGCGVVVGLACGWIASKAYAQIKAGNQPHDDDDHRFGPRP